MMRLYSTKRASFFLQKRLKKAELQPNGSPQRRQAAKTAAKLAGQRPTAGEHGKKAKPWHQA
ncbi:hypothetical protein [Vogesella urethralis]|uniref:hypothetical protein n=1 Tax=Vogesella urethralis TaxID=2592656 RepID=UPI001184EE2D|nr:hypothetical protein [Vogesella urethralis]